MLLKTYCTTVSISKQVYLKVCYLFKDQSLLFTLKYLENQESVFKGKQLLSNLREKIAEYSTGSIAFVRASRTVYYEMIDFWFLQFGRLVRILQRTKVNHLTVYSSICPFDGYRDVRIFSTFFPQVRLLLFPFAILSRLDF